MFINMCTSCSQLNSETTEGCILEMPVVDGKQSYTFLIGGISGHIWFLILLKF